MFGRFGAVCCPGWTGLREPYPIIKLHGYEIRASALVEQIEQLGAMSRIDRASIPGMNPERSHSIIGGGVVARALMQRLGTDQLLVSGQGLREGLARHPDPPSACAKVTAALAGNGEVGIAGGPGGKVRAPVRAARRKARRVGGAHRRCRLARRQPPDRQLAAVCGSTPGHRKRGGLLQSPQPNCKYNSADRPARIHSRGIGADRGHAAGGGI